MSSYPPSTLEEDFVDNTPIVDVHPNHHNALADAINTIVTELGNDVKGSYGDLKARLTAIAASITTNTNAISTEATSRANADTTLQTNINNEATARSNADALRELLTNKATDFSTVNNTVYPTVQAVQNAIASAVTGLASWRGLYDASANAYPSSGGSGVAGAIRAADYWISNGTGTLGVHTVKPGDLIIAVANTPGQTSSNWDILEHDLDYAPEDVANKDTDSTFTANSDTKYPSQKAVKTAVDLKVAKSANGSDFASPGATRGNLKIPTLFAGDALSVVNQTLSGLPTVGITAPITLTDSQQLYCTGQSDPIQNGPWIVHSGAWARPTDFSNGLVVKSRLAGIVGGDYAGTIWQLSTSVSLTVDTDPQVWIALAGKAVTDALYPSKSDFAARHFEAFLGDGAALSFVVTHNLGFKYPIIQCQDISYSPPQLVELPIEYNSTSQCTVYTGSVAFGSGLLHLTAVW